VEVGHVEGAIFVVTFASVGAEFEVTHIQNNIDVQTQFRRSNPKIDVRKYNEIYPDEFIRMALKIEFINLNYVS
jgi:hypothetical protein